MPRLTGKELADLYPKAKSFDELANERHKAELLHRPKNVPLKIASWSTLSLVVVLGGFFVIYSLISSSLSSEGAVIAATSFSMLLAALGCLVLWHLYTVMSDILDRVTLGSARYNTVVALILLCTGALLTILYEVGIRHPLVLVGGLVANFVVTLAAVKRVSAHDSDQWRG